MRKKLWYAYWIQDDPYHEGRLLNCIRGPKDTLNEMTIEVQQIYHGKAEFIELEAPSLMVAKPILRDKLALLHQDAARAMRRFSIKSIPGAYRLEHVGQNR